MNYFRTFLDSFRERVASVKTYISILVFGDSSISSVIVHKPFPDPDGGGSVDEDATAPKGGSVDEEDVYYSTDEEEEKFYDAVDRRMYRVYLNMTKAVKGRRWTFVKFKAVLARDRLLWG